VPCPAAPRTLASDPGRLDVLVNNAAAFVDWNEVASQADLAAAHDVIEVNLFGAWPLTNALLALLHAIPAARGVRRIGTAFADLIRKAPHRRPKWPSLVQRGPGNG